MRNRALFLLLTPLLLACGTDRPAVSRGGLTVVATIHPIASITSEVAGSAEVRTLLPPGAHPDTYEARPRDAEAMAAADLLVRVGGAADAWVGSPAGMPVVEFTEGMDLLADGNPHVWLDPIRVRDVFVPRLLEALGDIAPDSAAAFRERAAAFSDSLTALDAEIRAILEDAPGRRFIAAHPAWDYFAERYDLESVGVLHASPGREVGTRELAGLVQSARGDGVRAVIAEPQLGRAGVDALARELDARVEIADPVGGPALEGREDYLSLMRFNARAFARALGASAGSTP